MYFYLLLQGFYDLFYDHDFSFFFSASLASSSSCFLINLSTTSDFKISIFVLLFSRVSVAISTATEKLAHQKSGMKVQKL